MEMIDVLKKLESIAESKPELVADAVANVKATNPKEVQENTVEMKFLISMLVKVVVQSKTHQEKL